MKTPSRFRRRSGTLAMLGVGLAFCLAPLHGCEEKTSPTPKPAAGGGQAHGHGHSHGEAIQLGEEAVGLFTVKASREGEIKPGGDVSIDAEVSGGTAKVSIVRFWIGTQDAKGSVKAKADLEGDHWHAHVEVPNPVPEGGKLWVEIETDGGERHFGAFDLKP